MVSKKQVYSAPLDIATVNRVEVAIGSAVSKKICLKIIKFRTKKQKKNSFDKLNFYLLNFYAQRNEFDIIKTHGILTKGKNGQG